MSLRNKDDRKRFFGKTSEGIGCFALGFSVLVGVGAIFTIIDGGVAIGIGMGILAVAVYFFASRMGSIADSKLYDKAINPSLLKKQLIINRFSNNELIRDVLSTLSEPFSGYIEVGGGGINVYDNNNKKRYSYADYGLKQLSVESMQDLANFFKFKIMWAYPKKVKIEKITSTTAGGSGKSSTTYYETSGGHLGSYSDFGASVRSYTSGYKVYMDLPEDKKNVTELKNW